MKSIFGGFKHWQQLREESKTVASSGCSHAVWSNHCCSPLVVQWAAATETGKSSSIKSTLTCCSCNFPWLIVAFPALLLWLLLLSLL